MNDKEEDGENQAISQLLLTKLYDKTGNSRGGNKGFILFSVDKRGEVVYISKFSDTVTEIALATSARAILNELSTEIEDND
jgi:hypothetical protein